MEFRQETENFYTIGLSKWICLNLDAELLIYPDWCSLYSFGLCLLAWFDFFPSWNLIAILSFLSTSVIKFSSVAQLCSTLCDPMECSTPGFPVHHHLLEFAQIHVHWIGDAINLILCRLLLLPPSVFPNIRVFSNDWLFASGGQTIGASVSVSVLPMNIQGWFPLGLIGLISLQSKGFSRVFCSTTFWKHQFFGAQSSLWSNSHIHTWPLENHSFD